MLIWTGMWERNILSLTCSVAHSLAVWLTHTKDFFFCFHHISHFKSIFSIKYSATHCCKIKKERECSKMVQERHSKSSYNQLQFAEGHTVIPCFTMTEHTFPCSFTSHTWNWLETMEVYPFTEFCRTRNIIFFFLLYKFFSHHSSLFQAPSPSRFPLCLSPSTFPPSLFHAPESWRLVPVASLAYSSTHPPPYCSLVPLHPSLHLSSLPPPLLATLASFGSWWGVTALPLSGRESPLTKSVCVCVCVDAGVCVMWLPVRA